MSFSNTRTTEVVKASGATTATGTTSAFDPGTGKPGDSLAVMLNVTAATGTTPSMTVAVEWSNDGTNWYVADPSDTFTAITAVRNVTKVFTIKGTYARLQYTITGTTPSFTWAAFAVVGD